MCRSSTYSTMIVISRVHRCKNPRKADRELYVSYAAGPVQGEANNFHRGGYTAGRWHTCGCRDGGGGIPGIIPTTEHQSKTIIYTIDGIVTAFYVYRSSAYSTTIVISRVHGSKNPRKADRELYVSYAAGPVQGEASNFHRGGYTAGRWHTCGCGDGGGGIPGVTPTTEHQSKTIIYTIDGIVTAFYVFRSSAYSTTIVISRVHGSKNPRKADRELYVSYAAGPVQGEVSNFHRGGCTAGRWQGHSRYHPNHQSKTIIYIYIYRRQYSDGILCSYSTTIVISRVHRCQNCRKADRELYVSYAAGPVQGAASNFHRGGCTAGRWHPCGCRDGGGGIPCITPTT